jgi:hypothetical protein
MAHIHLVTAHPDAAHYAQQQAGTQATELHRLAEAATGEGSLLWLSGPTVWTVRPEEDGWAVHTMPATEAAAWAQHALAGVFATLVDPTRVTTVEDRDRTIGAWEDFRLLYLSAIDTNDPAAVDEALRDRMEQARRWMSILGMLRAHHIRDAFGTEHGAQANAARALDVHPATISGALADDRDHWAGWEYDVNEILSGRPPRNPVELD